MLVTPRDLDDSLVLSENTVVEHLDVVQTALPEDVGDNLYTVYDDLDMEDVDTEDEIDIFPEILMQKVRNTRTAWTTDSLVLRLIDEILDGVDVFDTLHKLRIAYKNTSHEDKKNAKSSICASLRNKVPQKKYDDICTILENFFC